MLSSTDISMHMLAGGDDAIFSDVVEAIVDHHKDFGSHKDTVLDGFRRIEGVGSACSLVAQSMEAS